MSGRVLTNLSGFQNRTLTGLSSIDTAETDIADIKTKYDFDSSVSTGNLLIGNSVGNYTTNRLTAGNNITITNGDGTISIASTAVEINAGTNLNKTTDINGTSLNLDAVIGGMTSINAFSLVTNISSAGNQFLLKDNSVGGFANGTFLTANASGLIVPTTQATINIAVQATLTGGTNITKTTQSVVGGGQTSTFNLDAVISGMTSINGFTISNDISSAESQFLVKDNSVGGFANGTFLTANASGLIVPTTQATINTSVQGTITGGTNITKTESSGNISLNLDNVLTSLTTINGYGFNLTTNSTVNQFLLKDTTVGSFSSGDLLNINSSGKVDNITPTVLFNNLTASNGLIKSSNNNNISISTQPTINISDSGGGGFTIENSSGTALVKITSSSGGQPKLQYFQGTDLRANQQYDNANTKFDFAVNTGALHLKAYSNTQGGTGRITLDSEIVKLQAGNSSTVAEDILTCSLTEIDLKKKIDLNQNTIHYYQGNNDGFKLGYSSSTMNGLLVIGYGGSIPFLRLQSSYGGAVNVVDYYYDKVRFFKQLLIEPEGTGVSVLQIRATGTGEGDQPKQQFFQQGNEKTYLRYLPADDIFEIRTTNDSTKMRLGNRGLTNGGLLLQNTRNDFYNKIYMNSTSSLDRPIYLHTNEAFYVRYKNDSTINGTDLGGFSGVRLSNTNTQSTNSIQLQTFGVSPRTADAKGSVEVYNKLSVIRNGATLQQDSNDTFTVKNTGFCKAIIHSDSGDCELALKCGSDNSNQTVIKRKTDDQFSISNVGEIKTSATSHNFFNSSTLRLAFQSDTNLVVYNGSTVKFASNDSQNAHSSRDYKKNINNLVESESINIIKNINPVSFEYLEQYWDEHDKCNACNCDLRKGFIWEDTQPILPQATRTINMNNPDEETTKTLDLKMVIPDLTKTVQYLLNKVETLETQLLTQSNLISNLQSQLNSN
jgi:hypothetical protein